MTSPDQILDSTSALTEAAHAFHRAAEARGSHRAAPESLALLQESLQVLSAAWYRVAADAVPGGVERGGHLSREQEVRLIGGLHDVAAAFARCARACREGRSTVAPVIARQMPADPASAGHVDEEPSWFAGRRPPATVLR